MATLTATAHDDSVRKSVKLTREYPLGDWALWKFLAEEHLIKQWFPGSYTFEPWDGGILNFHTEDPTDAEGAVVIQYEAPHHFSFTWGGNEVDYQVESLDDSHVRFTLTDTLEQGDQAARNAAGWELCLNNLDRIVAGEAPTEFSWDEWREYYNAYIAQGFEHGAEIPGE